MSSICQKRRQDRYRRKAHIRKRINGTAERPRLSVFRSHKNIYAQVVDDLAGRTMMAMDGKRAAEVEVPEGVTGKCARAYCVGRALAEQAKQEGIATMVFDRSGYLYHGRIAALARGLRDGGIEV